MTPAETRVAHGESLGAWHQRVMSVRDRARERFGPLTSEQLGWAPDAKSWSVGECLEHLIITGEGYLPRFEEAIERARALGEPRSGFKPRWFARFFHRFVDPDGTAKVKAPGAFQPKTATYDTRIVAWFSLQQEELEQIIQSAHGVDLNRVKFASPVTRLIRFSLGEGLWIVSSHLERHLRQAIRVTEAEGFPKS